MKGFCIYHKKDFDRFTEEQEQKQKLVDHHGKAIEIVEAYWSEIMRKLV